MRGEGRLSAARGRFPVFGGWRALAASLLLHGIAVAGLATMSPSPAPIKPRPRVVLTAAMLPAASGSGGNVAPGPQSVEAPKPPSPEEMAQKPPATPVEPEPSPKTPPVKPITAKTNVRTATAIPKPAKRHVKKVKPVEQAKTVQAEPVATETAASAAGTGEARASDGGSGAAGPGKSGAGSRPDAAPGYGRGVGAGDYYGIILTRLESVKRYPDEARKLGREGKVLVRFVLDRSGKVLSCRIEKGSGLAAIDREVMDMVRKAAPFPPFPDSIVRDELVLVAPVVFSLRQG